MSDMIKRMIGMREKALELRQEPSATTADLMDAATAQQQGLSAIETGAKAWRDWFELRSIQP